MVDKCFEKIKHLLKATERLDEAEALYGKKDQYGALSKVGAAFTSAALAYSKGLLDKEEWREIAGNLHLARQSILLGRELATVMKNLDRAKDILSKKMFEKYSECEREI